MKTKQTTPFRRVAGSLALGTFLLVASTGSAFAHGCTPGYWKQEQHFDSWPGGYAPGDNLQSYFGSAAFDATLLDALNYGGGPGVDGAKRILLRAAVAGLLNAAHDGIDFGQTENQMMTKTAQRLESGDRAYMLALAEFYDSRNNAGCPLN